MRKGQLESSRGVRRKPDLHSRRLKHRLRREIQVRTTELDVKVEGEEQTLDPPNRRAKTDLRGDSPADLQLVGRWLQNKQEHVTLALNPKAGANRALRRRVPGNSKTKAFMYVYKSCCWKISLQAFAR